MHLYVLPEKGLVGEVELFRYFLDGLVRTFQPVLDMFYRRFIDQVQRSPATRLLDDFRKMLGSVAKRIRIITHRTVHTLIFR